MSPRGQQPGFFDKNTVIAIVLSFAVFFAWQSYMAKKYPKPLPAETATTAASPVTAAPGADKSVSTAPLETIPGEKFEPQILPYENENFRAQISNFGMGLQRLELKKFTDRTSDKPVVHDNTGALPLISTSINNLRNFSVRQLSEHEFEGTIQNNDWNIRKNIKFVPEKYLAEVTLVAAPTQKQKIKVVSNISGPVEKISRSFLLPAYEYQEFFVTTPEKNNRNMVDPDKAYVGDLENVQIASFNTQYFAMAMANRSELLPKAHMEAANARGSVDMIYETPQPVDSQTLKYDFYFGPKKMDILKTVDDNFTYMVDYGFFGFIARPMFWLLKVLQQFIGNWGICIILLTLLMRATLLPINIYSMRSMKKMQRLQPKLQAIKEKYKNDPTRINQETLQIMRAEKANPLSGCLPMLLQIPIFFGFYQMLAKSFEFYKQPFALWIFDLSSKDPYFVLPILAGGMMFLQQKMTPMTTVDPTQAKVMMFMPLVFTVFMLSTPSGLALYMFISGAFGIFQQMAFMKERTT